MRSDDADPDVGFAVQAMVRIVTERLGDGFGAQSEAVGFGEAEARFQPGRSKVRLPVDAGQLACATDGGDGNKRVSGVEMEVWRSPGSSAASWTARPPVGEPM